MLEENSIFSMDGSHPLITIGITCFNAADTIERAILSAIRQNWPNKEIVIVDDASSDSSLAVIDRLVHEHPNIRLIRHEVNKGFPAALNTILSAANGDFIAFFDDDDESRSDRIALQWQRIDDYERIHATDLIFCYSNRLVVPVGQDKPTQTVLAIGRCAPEPHGNMVSDFLLCLVQTPPFVWGQFGSCTMMARRSTFMRLGGFDEAFRRGAEWDMAIRASTFGVHFIAVDQPIMTQFLSPSAGNEKSGKAPLKYALELRYKHRAYLTKQGLYWASIAQAHARFHYAKGNRVLHRFYTVLACILSPHRLAPCLLAQRRLARGSA